MYIRRNIEQKIIDLSKRFKVLYITGARGVGKTTVTKYLLNNYYYNYTYVTLEDFIIRKFALNSPSLFLQRYTPPVVIDEIQYAPELLKH